MRTFGFGGSILAALLLVPFSATAASAAVAPPGDIQKALDQYTAQFTNVGIVVGVVADGTAATYTSGSLGAGAPTLDDRTVFEIGSVTKTFTATLLAQMAGSGAVALDDPIGKFLPHGVTAPSYGGQQITLANLAEQNSGLPRLPGNLTVSNPADPYASYTPALLYAYLSHAKLDRAPGATYEYSNLGVGLLGDLLAARAGTTYAQLLTQRVLTPLGLTDTAITPTATMNAHLAPGHTIDGEPQGRWTFAALAGAGALLSDGHDMLAYLKANMAAPDGPLGKAMALAQAPRSDIDTGGPPMKIGLVWNVERSGVVWHNGETGGYHALIGFDRANRNGIVLLANVADQNLDTLALHLLEPDTVSGPTPFPPIVQVAPATIDTYAGVYQLAPSFAITVTHDGQNVYAQATGQRKLRIYPSSPTEFFYKAVDAQITFELDATGHVTRLILHQGGRDLPGPKVK